MYNNIRKINLYLLLKLKLIIYSDEQRYSQQYYSKSSNIITKHIIRIITFSDDNSVSSTLSVGDPNNNYYSEIKVHVRDFYNGYVVVTLPVTVIHN